MNDFDDGGLGRQTMNPWEEGDYRVHGYAISAPGGGYLPAYVVDRFRGIPDAPRIAVELVQIQCEPLVTKGLAEVMAVSHGVNRVRSGFGLKF